MAHPYPKVYTHHPQSTLPKWRECGRLPVSMSDAQAVLLNNKLYIGGGDTEQDDPTSICVYDFTNDLWHVLKSPSSCSALTTYQGRLVLIGEWDASTGRYTNQLWMLQCDEKTWTQPLPPMSTPRCWASALSINQHIFVAGGIDEDYSSLDIVEVYDGQQWSRAQSLPGAGCRMKSTLYNGHWYLIGGQHSFKSEIKIYSQKVFRTSLTVYQQNIVEASVKSASISWEILEETPLKCSAVVVYGNQLLCVGGQQHNDLPASAIFAYSPNAGKSWTKVGDLPVGLCLASAIVLPNAHLLVAGGSVLSQSLESSDQVFQTSAGAKGEIKLETMARREMQLHNILEDQQQREQIKFLQAENEQLTKSLKEATGTTRSYKERELSLQEECNQRGHHQKAKKQLLQQQKNIRSLRMEIAKLKTQLTRSRLDTGTTEGSFYGADVVGETEITISRNGRSYEWKQYGLKLHVPESSLSAGSESYRISIKVTLSGQFEFPEDSELVSPIFWISVPRKFLKPVIVEIQHCVITEDVASTSDLSFVTAKRNRLDLPYKFRTLDGGVFTPYSSYGSISVSHFCGIGCTSKKGGGRRQNYCVHIYYKRKSNKEWSVYFVITKDLEAVANVVKQHYDGSTTRNDTLRVQFQSSKISLDIPDEGRQTPEGWHITPRSPPSISKKDVDDYKPGYWIPECELIIRWKKEADKPVYLSHQIKLIGTKPPGSYFYITLDPDCEGKEDVLLSPPRSPTYASSLSQGSKRASISTGSSSSDISSLMAEPLQATNWQYETMSRNTSAIIKALVTNSLTDTLAGELRARKVIGVAVHAQATSYGPNITSNMRAERLITAMLSKIEFNPQRYHDFIEVLHLDGIKEDAEAALALLPNEPQQGQLQ